MNRRHNPGPDIMHRTDVVIHALCVSALFAMCFVPWWLS